MKKTVLTGLAVGLMMAGTAFAAPIPETYSQTFYGSATDGEYVSLAAGGTNNSVSLNFDLKTTGYVPGTYNPISSAYMKFFFSDIDAGVPDTVKISAGLYDGNAKIKEQTFNLGLFVPATYKTITVTSHSKPGDNDDHYISDRVCVGKCDDFKKDTSDDKYEWKKQGHESKYSHDKPGDGYSSDKVCKRDCDNKKKDVSDDKYEWKKRDHETKYSHDKPGDGYSSDKVCKRDCDNYEKDDSNDEYVWTKEVKVIDVAAHYDRTYAELIIDLAGFLEYLQDGTFTTIVLTPDFSNGCHGYDNDIRLDEAFLSATTAPFDPPQNPVPEPSTIVLLGAGLLGAGLVRRRMKK